MTTGLALDPTPPTPDPVPVEATPKATGIPHVAAFDGLRGAAVAAVLLNHANHLEGGYLGVDLFFVLSGYLITALLLTGWRSEDRVELKRFWGRRARRLAPALIITLVGVGLYATFVSNETELLGVRWDGLATLFEVANWRTIAIHTDYFAQTLRPSPLRHTWSLSIEEQCYLVWPLVVAAVLRWRRSPVAVFVVSSVGAVASAGWMVFLWHRGGLADTSRLYYGTDTRAAAVLIGAAVASGRVALGSKRWARTRDVRHVLGALAAVGLAVAWLRLDGDGPWPYRGVLPLVSLGGALVIASVADRRHPGPVGWVASFAPLAVVGRAARQVVARLDVREHRSRPGTPPPMPDVRRAADRVGRALDVERDDRLGAVARFSPLGSLGRISYGVYLYHWPIFLVLDEARTGLSGWTLVLVQVVVSIAAAAVSYRFIEEPIRRGRALRGRQARAALPAAAAFAAIVLFATTLGAVAPPSAADVANTVDRSSVPGAPTVLLAGDSVPLVLGFELAKQKDELGVSVANRSQPGCHLLAGLGPVRGIEGNVRTDVADCAADHRYRDAVRGAHADLSVVMFGDFPNESVRIDGRWQMPCEASYLAAYKRKVNDLIDDLQVTGKPVVLLTAPGTSLSWVLERVKPGMPERVACLNRLLVDIADSRPQVSVVDLAGFVCPPDQPCLQEADGVNLRTDGLHFRDEGAAYVNRWLIPRVLVAAQEP